MHHQGEIQITQVSCNKPTHAGEFIRALCPSPMCKESCTLCAKCLMKTHLMCRNQVLEIELIPQQLQELLELKQDIGDLKDKINHQFKELLSRIEQMLLPIQKYQDSPNFTNLDRIGTLLRAKQTIYESIDEIKIKIKDNLDNSIFASQLQNSSKLMLMKPIIKQSVTQIQSDQDVWSYFYKGRELYDSNKYIEAIEYFEKAIQMDSKHLESHFYKGQSLFNLNQYDQAIQCYDSAIIIEPNQANWNAKGEALKQIGNFEDSRRCFLEALRINSNCQRAKDNLERVTLILQNKQ